MHTVASRCIALKRWQPVRSRPQPQGAETTFRQDTAEGTTDATSGRTQASIPTVPRDTQQAVAPRSGRGLWVDMRRHACRDAHRHMHRDVYRHVPPAVLLVSRNRSRGLRSDCDRMISGRSRCTNASSNMDRSTLTRARRTAHGARRMSIPLAVLWARRTTRGLNPRRNGHGPARRTSCLTDLQ